MGLKPVPKEGLPLDAEPGAMVVRKVLVCCPSVTCPVQRSIQLDLVHEDEMGIGYAGVCSTCGSEITVHYSKGDA